MTTAPASARPALELNPVRVFALSGVSYEYDSEAPALHNISFEVYSGESIALLGANASGKSTLIKLMDGLLHPTAGSITAFGEPLTETSLRDGPRSRRFRRRVAYVFQNADAQLFSSSVREEIAFGPLQLGLSANEVERRVGDISALLEIDKLLDRAPFQLSGGEKRKVAIASSLAVNPDVLLLDEPTAGLDPRSQHWLVELLKRLNDAGKTIIASTHDLGIVPLIARRALVISEEHELVADGPSASVLADYALLNRVNLIHEHLHRHGNIVHSHPHFHDHDHEHHHHTDGDT